MVWHSAHRCCGLSQIGGSESRSPTGFGLSAHSRCPCGYCVARNRDSRRNPSKHSPCHAANPRLCGVAASQARMLSERPFAFNAYTRVVRPNGEQKANAALRHTEDGGLPLPISSRSANREACLGTPVATNACSISDQLSAIDPSISDRSLAPLTTGPLLC